MPESKYAFFMEIFSMLIKLYFVIVIPLDIGFDSGILYKGGKTITLVLSLLLIAYFFNKLFIVYYEFGQPVTDKWKVFVF